MRKAPQSQKSLLSLIERVYEAALDESQWRTVAPAVAETFFSTSTTLQVRRVEGVSQTLSVTDNVNSRLRDYNDHYWQRDIWIERAARLVGMSQVATSADLVTDEEFAETEFYRDWCRHLNVFYVVGAVFPSGDGTLGVLGVHRPRAAGNYTDADKSIVARFLPHLERSLRVREQLALATLKEQISLAALARCQTAILLVLPDARIVYANPEAEALLRAATAICSRQGRLTATNARDQPLLAALIRSTSGLSGSVSNSSEVALRLNRAGGPPLSAISMPFRLTWRGLPAPAALVLLRDPNRPISALAGLRSLFGFTPTEARIAQALMNGISIAEIAQNHRAFPQTVRKQVKAVLAKTGTRRQSECVAVLLRSVASIDVIDS